MAIHDGGEPGEMAFAIDRRKALYEEMHPETAHEARPGRAGKCRHDGNSSSPADRFNLDTAKTSGKDARTVQRMAAVADGKSSEIPKAPGALQVATPGGKQPRRTTDGPELLRQ